MAKSKTDTTDASASPLVQSFEDAKEYYRGIGFSEDGALRHAIHEVIYGQARIDAEGNVLPEKPEQDELSETPVETSTEA
jgi:hypothetical protein